eukprot:CAMPEP_0173171048 /NCGR_PEP_ID=MMETSP1141-20130122/1550_1 /TAXON_ID=483371 /ORGANISM="non described non described, Strain CCMP2298" /LENGTH=127 /DNA_ID=CAMNT_0014092957 /DNA_START=232 /DNA_END=615 /DNA_ORIENTATION=-
MLFTQLVHAPPELVQVLLVLPLHTLRQRHVAQPQVGNGPSLVPNLGLHSQLPENPVEGEGQHQWIGHEVEGGPIPLGQLPTLTEEIETVQNLRHHVVSRPHELPPTQVHLLVNPVPQPPPARSLQLQ